MIMINSVGDFQEQLLPALPRGLLSNAVPDARSLGDLSDDRESDVIGD